MKRERWATARRKGRILGENLSDADLILLLLLLLLLLLQGLVGRELLFKCCGEEEEGSFLAAVCAGSITVRNRSHPPGRHPPIQSTLSISGEKKKPSFHSHHPRLPLSSAAFIDADTYLNTDGPE